MLPVPKDSFLGRLYWKCLSFIIRPKPRKECRKYWRYPGDSRNSPESYIFLVGRSHFLLKIMKKYVEPQMKIMEIGYNVGRNLNYLFKAGYKNLAGVEIL